MKAKHIALALAATAFGIVSASAQTVIVKEKTPDVVVKERVVTPGVTVTTGSGVSDCSTKKVVRKNELTDTKTTKTVRRCD
jgi:hypothetical protein